ncbi:MAG: histidine kinase [Actinomycetota bacterium]|nr:histidine kinase [Actinomycetota bacterium]
MSEGAPVTSAPRWWRLGVTGAVVVLTLTVAWATIADGFLAHPGPGAALGASASVAGAAALLWRRRWPAPVLALEVAAVVTTNLFSPGVVHNGATFLVVVALYNFGTLHPPFRTALGAAGAAIAILGAEVLHSGEVHGLAPDLLLLTAVTAVSFYVRSHRALLASYRARAEQAEQAQRWTAARAVTEERARIARELHDVVAHHVSLLVVQAGAVRENLPAEHPTRAVLDSMIGGGRLAMAEMRSMLDALRFDDESERGAQLEHEGGEQPAEPATSAGIVRPLRPQPTMDQIPVLVHGARCAGLTVTYDVEGPVVPVAPATALAVYRIVQEALTNAVKHARGAGAIVRLRYDPLSVEATVTNGAPTRSPGTQVTVGSGHGVVGMRERAALARGTIRVGPVPGGWEVAAAFPLVPAGQPTGDSTTGTGSFVPPDIAAAPAR